MIFLALLIAISAIINYFERYIPLSIVVPGVKPGLSNVILLVVLYSFSAKDAFLVLVLRILLSGFLLGNPSSLFFSFGGGLLALIIMITTKKFQALNLSIIGVSISGAVFHNIGQIIVASIINSTPLLITYLPVLMISSIVTGILTGVTAKYLISLLRPTLNVIDKYSIREAKHEKI